MLADNGSTDRTNEIFRSFAGPLPDQWRIVDASGVPGPSFARNIGATAARGELFLFVDADDVVAPGYVAAMRDALGNHQLVTSSIEYDGVNPDWSRPKEALAPLRQLQITLDFLPFAGSGRMGIHRSLFESLGGFDTDFLGCEDVDFSWRAQLNGIELVLVPEAVLRYRYRTTFRGYFRQAFRDGKSRPALYRRFRHLGMPRQSWRRAPSFYAAVVPMAWRARTRADLAGLYRAIGIRLGLICGSLMNRVWYL